MSAKPTYETQRIDHLGIVAGICGEISLIEKINAQVKPSERKVSCGKGTHHKSALPVWLEVLSGNSSDKKTFKATIKAYCKQLRAEEQAYVVMDSAGF